MPEEKLDEKEAIQRLNQALTLQYRSALQYTMASGAIFGLEQLALGDHLWEFAAAELADVRALIEKIAALGGDPTTEAAEHRFIGEAEDAVEAIIGFENEAIEALQAAIEPTGREGRSEALEHMLEHMIMRKQGQVDFLLRARRTS
jgi:bacterioferritin (cytochrome b1)